MSHHNKLFFSSVYKMYENIFTTPFKGMQPQYKMEYTKKTVIELRKIAKQSGMVGYTRLRKADLIAKIEANETQTLIPSHFTPISPYTNSHIETPPQTPVPVTTVRKLCNKIKSAMNTCAKAIKRKIPKQPFKVVKEEIGRTQTKITSYF